MNAVFFFLTLFSDIVASVKFHAGLKLCLFLALERSTNVKSQIKQN